jgi:hypothetical protein
MSSQAYSYDTPVRQSGPDVSEEIMEFLFAVIDLVMNQYIPGRKHELYKMDYGNTVITAKIVPIEGSQSGDRVSIRVRRGDLTTQFFSAIKSPDAEPANDALPPAKGKVVN